jgi:hypothetical protein
VKLDAEEKEQLESVERGQWKSSSDAGMPLRCGAKPPLLDSGAASHALRDPCTSPNRSAPFPPPQIHRVFRSLPCAG